MFKRKPAVELFIFNPTTQELTRNGEPVTFTKMKNPLPISIAEKQGEASSVVSFDGKILSVMYVSPEEDAGSALLSTVLREDPRPAETVLKDLTLYRRSVGVPDVIFGYGRSRDKTYRLAYNFTRGGLLRTELTDLHVEHVIGGQTDVATQINGLFKIAKNNEKAVTVMSRLAWHVGRGDYTPVKMRERCLRVNAWGEDDVNGVNGLLTDAKIAWPDLPVMVLISTLLNIFDNLHHER